MFPKFMSKKDKQTHAAVVDKPIVDKRKTLPTKISEIEEFPEGETPQPGDLFVHGNYPGKVLFRDERYPGRAFIFASSPTNDRKSRRTRSSQKTTQKKQPVEKPDPEAQPENMENPSVIPEEFPEGEIPSPDHLFVDGNFRNKVLFRDNRYPGRAFIYASGLEHDRRELHSRPPRKGALPEEKEAIEVEIIPEPEEFPADDVPIVQDLFVDGGFRAKVLFRDPRYPGKRFIYDSKLQHNRRTMHARPAQEQIAAGLDQSETPGDASIGDGQVEQRTTVPEKHDTVTGDEGLPTDPTSDANPRSDWEEGVARSVANSDDGPSRANEDSSSNALENKHTAWPTSDERSHAAANDSQAETPQEVFEPGQGISDGQDTGTSTDTTAQDHEPPANPSPTEQLAAWDTASIDVEYLNISSDEFSDQEALAEQSIWVDIDENAENALHQDILDLYQSWKNAQEARDERYRRSKDVHGSDDKPLEPDEVEVLVYDQPEDVAHSTFAGPKGDETDNDLPMPLDGADEIWKQLKQYQKEYEKTFREAIDARNKVLRAQKGYNHLNGEFAGSGGSRGRSTRAVPPSTGTDWVTAMDTSDSIPLHRGASINSDAREPPSLPNDCTCEEVCWEIPTSLSWRPFRDCKTPYQGFAGFVILLLFFRPDLLPNFIKRIGRRFITPELADQWSWLRLITAMILIVRLLFWGIPDGMFEMNCDVPEVSDTWPQLWYYPDSAAPWFPPKDENAQRRRVW